MKIGRKVNKERNRHALNQYKHNRVLKYLEIIGDKLPSKFTSEFISKFISKQKRTKNKART